MSAFDQSSYQVRFEWGVDGLRRLAPSDVVIVVDVFGLSASAIVAAERGEACGADAASASAAACVAVAADSGAVVFAGGLRNASALAQAVMAVQHARAARTSIAVIAVGADATAPVRFAVEDQFGAGAVIDALAAIGIDHSSPEAAAAGESFAALRGAVRHLLTASGAGRALAEAGCRDDVLAAATVDAASVVPRFAGGTFA